MYFNFNLAGVRQTSHEMCEYKYTRTTKKCKKEKAGAASFSDEIIKSRLLIVHLGSPPSVNFTDSVTRHQIGAERGGF